MSLGPVRYINYFINLGHKLHKVTHNINRDSWKIKIFLYYFIIIIYIFQWDIFV